MIHEIQHKFTHACKVIYKTDYTVDWEMVYPPEAAQLIADGLMGPPIATTYPIDPHIREILHFFRLERREVEKDETTD